MGLRVFVVCRGHPRFTEDLLLKIDGMCPLTSYIISSNLWLGDQINNVVMRKKYSSFVACMAALFLLAGCGKEAPDPKPAPTPSPDPSMPNLPPPPAQPIMEVETRDNVMVYTPPEVRP